MKKRTITIGIDVDEDIDQVSVEIHGDADQDTDLVAAILIDAATKVKTRDPLYVEWKEV